MSGTASGSSRGRGRIGWDNHDGAHFHRELPADTGEDALATGRAAAARRLADGGAVTADGEARKVDAGDAQGPYTVRGTVCSCAWSRRYGASHGPCVHVLAVGIGERGR